MPNIVLTGKVLTPGTIVNIDGVPKVNWQAPEHDLKTEWNIRIINSIVIAECEANRFAPELAGEFWRQALDLSRIVVDLMGFAQARGMTVVIDQIRGPDGVGGNLLYEAPSLAQRVTSFAPDRNFAEAWEVVLKEPTLFMAMNDLMAMMTAPHQSPINCARVVEGLSHILGGIGEDPAKRWAALREAVRVDRAYIQLISNVSTDPRHGNRSHIAPDILREITERTWTIVDRFFHYRLRGSNPLPEVEFPELTG